MDGPYAELVATDEDRAAARRYAAVIEWTETDGVCVATAPDFPNLRTRGATREAAATATDEATALRIAGARETSIPAPPPRFSALPPPGFAAARRRRLRLTQRGFAHLLDVSASAVRGREQQLRSPDGAPRRRLGIAEREPEALLPDASPVWRVG